MPHAAKEGIEMAIVTNPGGRVRGPGGRRAWRIGVAALAVATAAVGLAACGSGSSASGGGGATITGKFGFIQAANTPTGRSATQFAQLVSKYTNGTVKIDVYPNSQLGTGDSMLQATEGGTVSFYSSPVLSSVVPESSALELPFLFPTEQDGSKILNDGSLDSALWNKFTAHNLTYMGSWMVGYSSILTRDTKINSSADVKGLRIRVFEPVVSTKLYSALGGTAVTLDGNQVVSALSTHTIDGVDDPPSTLTGNNFYDGMHDVALTKHILVTSPVIASSKFLSQLSKSQLAGVKRAMSESIAPNLADADKTNQQSLTTMQQAGITVTHPDEAAFRSASQNVTAALQGQFSGVIDAVKAGLQKSS
jgi:C4-dicarboxylate-binding protein DctP